MIAVAGFCLLIVAADRYAESNFGTTVDGDWFLLILASGEDELKSFALELKYMPDPHSNMNELQQEPPC